MSLALLCVLFPVILSAHFRLLCLLLCSWRGASVNRRVSLVKREQCVLRRNPQKVYKELPDERHGTDGENGHEHGARNHETPSRRPNNLTEASSRTQRKDERVRSRIHYIALRTRRNGGML